MRIVYSFDFFDEQGELVLKTGRLASHPCHQPLFLVSAVDKTAYLRRTPSDTYEFLNINGAEIQRLRCQPSLLVIEEGPDSQYTYRAPTALTHQVRSRRLGHHQIAEGVPPERRPEA
jgi:hypothetical protein